MRNFNDLNIIFIKDCHEKDKNYEIKMLRNLE